MFGLSLKALVLTVTLTLTGYAPMVGGIQGGACVRKPWHACFVQSGQGACGPGYPRGTVFVFEPWVQEYGMPRVQTCVDRGGLVTDWNYDAAFVSGDALRDLYLARRLAKRQAKASVYQNWDTFARLYPALAMPEPEPEFGTREWFVRIGRHLLRP